MDTRMLDVAIGLALVIAMLSLLVTVIREALAGIQNSRGNNLVRMVCSLVGDNKALSQEILAHPFLESMMIEKTSGQRAPSYLASDVFVTGLLGFLMQYTGGMRPATPAVLVAELKSKMPQNGQQRLVKSMAALLPGAESDWPAFEKRLQAWFDAVAERSSGWYKRENQIWLFCIGLALAFAMNINPIVIAKALWNDAALRKFAVAQAEVALQAYQAQTGAQVASISNRGTPALVAVPEQNRDATDQALASVRAKFEGADLANDSALRAGAHDAVLAVPRAQQMRDLLALERATAGNQSKRNQYFDAVAGFDLRLEQLRALVPVGANADCVPTAYLDCPKIKGLDAALSALSQAIAQERGIHEALSGDQVAAAILSRKCESLKASTPGTLLLCVQLRELGILNPSTIPIGWSEATWPRVFGDCRAAKKPASTETVGKATAASISDAPRPAAPPAPLASTPEPSNCEGWKLESAADLGNWGLVIAGWVLTALGATIGAPFWFDLLGKLVKLRSSGVKPTEGSQSAAAGSTPAPSTAAPPSTLTPALQSASDGARPASSDAHNDAEKLLTEDEITRVQRNLDMPATNHTGRLDLATRTAISVWQTRYGAMATGELTQAQIQELLTNPTTMKDDGYVG